MKISWKRNKRVIKSSYAQPVYDPKVASVWALLHTYSVKHESDWNPYLAGLFLFQHFMPMIPAFGCTCSSFFNEYGKKNAPQFNSPEEFRVWGINLHNAVNAKLAAEHPALYYPQITRSQYDVLWMDKAPKTSDKLVITVATSQQAKKLLRHTRERFISYADDCGADYVELTNELYSSWHLEKLRVGVFAAQYDQTLFLDVDCFPTKKCRNLFKESKGVAVVDDWEVLVRNKVTSWVYPEYKMTMESQGLGVSATWERCLNSGVLLCSREENPWVMPEKPLPGAHCSEQFWVDAQIKSYHQLPQACNWQWWRGKDFWRGLQDAEVIHFANCPQEDRLELMKWATENF